VYFLVVSIPPPQKTQNKAINKTKQTNKQNKNKITKNNNNKQTNKQTKQKTTTRK
jgi:hypothetical protein